MILDNDFSSENVALLDIVDTGISLQESSRPRVSWPAGESHARQQGIPRSSQTCQYFVRNDRSRGQADQDECTICAYSMGALQIQF